MIAHLLFVLVLMLPAPLFAGGGRTAVRRIGRITLVFAAALAVGAFSPVHPPARVVDVIIAIGILAGVAHAVRPIFGGREPLVAGVFGLGHGLALAPSSLPRAEALLLIVVALALPTLIVVSRLPVASAARIAGATLAAAGALIDLSGVVTGGGSHTTALLIVLAVLADAAGLHALIDRRRTAALEARLRRSATDASRCPSPRTPQDPLLAAQPHRECR
ncbi:HupE/UreJ family protein [Paractinoplanes atraurantiacus]|uniref:HupE / UreJ protein n=1 Tax=Paractinoplanes atraurantiacus TaxID=1036182 RepID=A0A285K838_9ACTN|nr:HupE/UreJ family protein [Actinoplanes atraurantiacus]SNY68750.1 HupE / UreJ protein [Actinoplanes atraurantiacus]